MNAHQVTSWMQTEHAKVRELAGNLGALTTAVPQQGLDAWVDDIRARFDHFRAHLYHHMALEEDGGYLESVLDVRPTLAADVERLRKDHKELGRIMDTIHQTLTDLKPEDRQQARECCYGIDCLLSYVEHHEKNENLLVTYVFTQDIGDHD